MTVTPTRASRSHSVPVRSDALLVSSKMQLSAMPSASATASRAHWIAPPRSISAWESIIGSL